MNGSHVLFFVIGMLFQVGAGVFAAWLLNPSPSLFLCRKGKTPHCAAVKNLNGKGGAS